jgi:hypothetical protein
MLNSEVELEEEINEKSEINITRNEVSSAVVYATDWTVETILSQIKRKNIIINVRFQRRDAWNITEKSRLIESMFLGIPIPPIVLAEAKDARGKFLVIDGKQRLLTLMQFCGVSEGKNNLFKLRNLEVLFNLKNKSIDDLENDFELNESLTQFLNYPIRSYIIRNWPNNDFLYMIFVRFNTGTKPLSPHELRQALFPGPFVDFLEEATNNSKAIKMLFKSNEPDFRIRDVELLLRYISFSFFISEYSGNLKKFLDDTCFRLNREWPEKEKQIKNQLNLFEHSIEAAGEIFGEDGVGRIWKNDRFMPKLNQAVLDVMAFYFSDEKIRKTALNNKGEVVKSFKTLCKNRRFIDSIEKTTKSLNAVSSRFDLWGMELHETLGLEFVTPKLIENRIKFSDFWPDNNE